MPRTDPGGALELISQKGFRVFRVVRGFPAGGAGACAVRPRRSFFPLRSANPITMPLAPNILDDLRRIVGPGEVLTSREDLIAYSFDGTAAVSQMPGVVVFVRSAQQVAALLRLANEQRIPVITQVLLKLIPKPAAKRTLVATFAAMDAAAQCVSDIIAAQIIPCTLEFLDRTTIHCVEDFAKVGLPLDCEALLLMETDGHPAAVAEEAAQMEALARKAGALQVRVAKDDAEATALAAARRSAFSALARVSPTTILEDATVPRSRLAEMIRFVEGVAKKHRLRIGTFGHMGDGNLHPTFLTDERNTDEMHRVHAAFQEIFHEAIRLGGTITGEHGVGLAKKDFLPIFAGDAQMRVMRELRRALDPRGILNPGKVFDHA